MYSGSDADVPPPSGHSLSPQVSKRRSVQAASPYETISPTAPAASGYHGSPTGNGTPKGSYTSSYAGGYYASGTAHQKQQLPATPQLSAFSPASPYKATETTWAPTSTSTKQQVLPSQRPIGYSHNTLTACLWLPCWCLVFLGQESTVPLQTFWMLGLVVYGLDLANLREVVVYMIWFSTLVQTLVSMWFRLLEEAGDDDAVLTILFGSAVQALFFTATACWVTLQCQWLVRDETSSVPRQLEAALHAVLPPIFSALVTAASTPLIGEASGSDTAATLAPHVFAIALVVAMLLVGAVESSFATGSAVFSNGSSGQLSSSSDAAAGSHEKPVVAYAIHKRVAWGHSALLLSTPGAMHLVMFMGRIRSRHASADNLCDLILAVAVPYLLFCLVQTLHNAKLRRSPYHSPASRSSDVAQLIPSGAAVLASLAAQQRYFIPICHRFSYHFMGIQSPTWLLTVYWTIATVSILASFWIWGRISPATGQPIFGEYHEDIVQLALAFSGLCLGKAFGLSWNMTPLPILGILGLSLWVSTRMLRYLSIFLFVLHATGVVVFTYRFVGIDQPLSLPLPGIELSLMRFGMLVTLSSMFVGLVTGLALRSSGGFMAPLLRKLDVAGMSLISYTVILLILEITLLKRPVPTKELAGVEVEEADIEETLYDPALTFLTSAILIGITLFMQHVRILQDWSSSVVISLALGKAAAVFIDAAESESGTARVDPRGTDVLYRALIAAVLCAVMFAPRLFLKPVHIKNSVRSRRSLSSGPDLPPGAVRLIGLYAFVFLPITLVGTIPYVLFPFVNAAVGKFANSSYYGVSTPVSEFIGTAIGLWGLALLSMLNHYLPDGGGEAWTKMSALAFLMGFGIFFVAPTLGMSIGAAEYSPYASMSSLGSQLIMRGKSRTGGWGMLSAALATLLAMSGPLELKERRHASGRKDKYLLFRTMTFSLLFGGGVAWFITVQSMSESDWLFLVLTLMASMALAFLGTIAAVLGYFVEQDNFDEVEQIAKTWLIGLVTFLPIAGVPQLLRPGSPHPFEAGGWLSTYLAVGCLSAFSFALSLSFRQEKDSMTRGLGNAGCVIAWLSAVVVLYGRYGVAGLDSKYDMSTIAGVPLSILGTIALAPILLALEGETSSQARGRRVTVTTSRKAIHSSTRLNLPQLTRSNRWFPLFVGTVAVFLCASLYAILLRGSGLFSFIGVSAARTHKDMFADAIGSLEASKGANDLAVLAEKTISHGFALATSAQLASSGFWTAKGFFAPLLHLAGVLSILPSLYMLVSQYWLGIGVASGQITFGLPLNAIPVLLCPGIPSLRAAAVLTVAGAAMQLLARRQSEQASRMRI